MFHIDKKTRNEELDSRFRASLMNSLSGVKNATLISTISAQGITNVTVFSSIVHLGASPALLGLIFRPVAGDTYKNIIFNKKFTLNLLPYNFSKNIHQSSARFNESEFSKCQLEEEYLGNFLAPFVKESPVKYSMEMIRIIDIPENGTRMMIAEVQDIYLENKRLLRSDGSLDISDKLCAVIGLDSYHEVKSGVRYSYAKPDRDLEILE